MGKWGGSYGRVSGEGEWKPSLGEIVGKGRRECE